jgi:hypothetical protein
VFAKMEDELSPFPHIKTNKITDELEFCEHHFKAVIMKCKCILLCYPYTTLMMYVQGVAS